MRDTSIFLAVCKDQPDATHGFYHSVYLVNNSGNTLKNLQYSTYGYCTMDDEFVQTNTYTETLGTLAPLTAMKIEEDDDGSFDFVIIFTFQWESKGKAVQKQFEIGKYLRGGVKPLQPIAVLNKFGYVFYA